MTALGAVVPGSVAGEDLSFSPSSLSLSSYFDFLVSELLMLTSLASNPLAFLVLGEGFFDYLVSLLLSFDCTDGLSVLSSFSLSLSVFL